MWTNEKEKNGKRKTKKDNEKVLHMCVFVLSAQKLNKILFGFKDFFVSFNHLLRRRLYSVCICVFEIEEGIQSFKMYVAFCLFAALAVMSAACLYIIQQYFFVVGSCYSLIPFYFLFSWLLMNFFVDVSVGVVVVCNLKVFFVHMFVRYIFKEGDKN